MQGKYKKIEEWLLFFMILFIPLKSLPARYKLPLLGKNVAVALLVTMCVVCLIWWLRNKKEFHIPHAKFVGLFCFFRCFLVYQYRSIHISILSRSY